MRALFPLLFLILSVSAAAQPCAVRGTLVNAQGKPLAFALVRVGNAGDLTDRDGRFLLPGLPEGAYTLYFSAVGYSPFTKGVTVSKGAVLDLGKLRMLLPSEVPPPAPSAPPARTTRRPASDAAVPAGSAQVYGVITDEKDEPIINAAVVVLRGGIQQGNTITDFDGNYSIKPLAAGEYTVAVEYAGYKREVVEGVLVSAEGATRINLKLEPAAHSAPATTGRAARDVATVEVRTRRYERPLFEERSVGSRTVLTAAEIEKMPTRNPPDAVSTSCRGMPLRGGLSIGGGRSENTLYVVDGIVAKGSGAAAKPARTRDDRSAPAPEAATASADAPAEASEVATTAARAGILTSGESNDFSKWTVWETLVEPALKQHSATWRLFPQRRYSLSVQAANGAPLVGAAVRLKSGSDILWEAVTDNTGRAELWAGITDTVFATRRLSAEARWRGRTYSLPSPKPFGENAPNILKTDAACDAPHKLDVAFIVDATGSMGDEISYLKTELTDILQKVADSLPKLDVQTAAVFYQDLYDRYVTDAQDFRPGIAQTVSFIGQHGAEGGGDTPEAVDMALDRMLSGLTWRDGTVAKIAFLVLDAPPHADPVTVARIQALTIQCAARGIRLVPVVCSGSDKSTEYVLRAMALATNGTYLFLTDHSGVGGGHTAPTTDRYDVEYLNGLVYRVIHQFSYLPECGAQAEVVPDTARQTQPIDSVASVRWSFYPNPTPGILNVEYSGLSGTFYVCDITGKALLRYEADGTGRARIDLTQYPSGVYLLRYQYAPEKWLSGRFVVAH